MSRRAGRTAARGSVATLLGVVVWGQLGAVAAAAAPDDGVMTVDVTQVVAGHDLTVTQVTPCPAAEGSPYVWIVTLGDPAAPLAIGSAVVGGDGVAGEPVVLATSLTAPAGDATIGARCVVGVGSEAATTLTYAPILVDVEPAPVGTFTVDPVRAPAGAPVQITTADRCPAPTLEGSTRSLDIVMDAPGATEPPFVTVQASTPVEADGSTLPVTITIPAGAAPGSYTMSASCTEAVPGMVVKTMLFEDRPFEVLAPDPSPDGGGPSVTTTVSTSTSTTRPPVQVLGSITLPRTGRSTTPLAAAGVVALVVGAALCVAAAGLRQHSRVRG